MSKNGAVTRIVIFGMLLAGAACAQGNRWPDSKAAGEETGSGGDRLLARLAELQNHTLNILQKAQFNGDLHTALEAVAEARANLELMAALSGRLPAREPARPSGPQTVYLIAFKDHVIRAAVAYAVEGTTLHFTTPQGTSEQAPLDAIDLSLTGQLNRERNVDIRLPPGK